MPQNDKTPVSGDLVSDAPELTLEDVCRACEVSESQIETYIAEGIIEPHGREPIKWRFSHVSLIAVRKARRLERDLGLNVAGVAVALDLMTQIEALKRRMAVLEHRSDSATEED